MAGHIFIQGKTIECNESSEMMSMIFLLCWGIEKELHFCDRRGAFFIEGSKADLVFLLMEKWRCWKKSLGISIFNNNRRKKKQLRVKFTPPRRMRVERPFHYYSLSWKERTTVRVMFIQRHFQIRQAQQSFNIS